MGPIAIDTDQRKIAFWGVLLLTVGFFTGFWTAAALTGAVTLKIPRLALATHLNALLGGFWLLTVAYSKPFLNYGAKQFQWLGRLSIVPAWANWGITFVASILGVNGLGYTGDRANDSIAVLLQLFVVLPTLVASLYWLRGFYYKGGTQ